ncbi:unnamed protein product [Thelazia callipaeda]|uniref:39S ribosomal protein L32, mitochondrial n=1 Tax=Thelazia callipaeda TaxID=103827 RepID=A0A158RB10_THECL|nr:unnamed protein product [Thelazia callipaeda]
MQRFRKYFLRYYDQVRCFDTLEPAFAVCGEFQLEDSSNERSCKSIEDVIEKFRIAFGVPKIRTCQAKKVTRKFDRNRTLQPKFNLEVCQSCGSYHDIGKICAVCYRKVHELTNLMKSKIMAYNPYIGERQSTNVKFEDDPRDGSGTETQDTSPRCMGRIVELGVPRPTWFKPKFVEPSVLGKK